MKPAKLNKTTFKPFNFLNFGNLYFYNKNQNNWYFYFNTLLGEYERNPPNPAYVRMANRIGEEAKSRLCLLTIAKSNVLVLDEPTNHLDVVAKEALKKAIDEYEGVVILVSHETDFYSDIVDYIIELDK
jgi:hypothetical protein